MASDGYASLKPASFRLRIVYDSGTSLKSPAMMMLPPMLSAASLSWLICMARVRYASLSLCIALFLMPLMSDLFAVLIAGFIGVCQSDALQVAVKQCYRPLRQFHCKGGIWEESVDKGLGKVYASDRIF